MAIVIERIANALLRQPGGVPVGDLARQLGLSYQGVRNEVERSGAQRGVWIDRNHSPAIARATSSRALTTGPATPARVRNTQPSTVDEAREPDWEGNVQARVCRWLLNNGWQLEQVANTATRERGTDIVARRIDRCIHIEVKGWPSRLYDNPSRRTEIKRTEPTNQAHHWFAGATLSCLRLRDEYPSDRVAMALPDRPRYRKLGEEVEQSLRALKIELWLVRDDDIDIRSTPR